MNHHTDHQHSENNIHGPEIEHIKTPSGIVDVSIFEYGVPPCFRITGADLDTCSITTVRENGDSHTFVMENKGAYWQSTQSIPEPHSFSVNVSLTQKGQPQEYALNFAEHSHDHDHSHSGHGHSHGMVDPSIVRSSEGVKAVSLSLLVLFVTAALQLGIFLLSNSVALLADLIHNFGDALTAIPLGLAFFLRSQRGEKWAGYFVVILILVSALVAGYEAVMRFIYPAALSHLWVVAAAGLIGFLGNELAAIIRMRAGKKLNSPALIADGNHAHVDGLVSLGVIASAAFVAVGLPMADPLIGLAITVLILRITWQSWKTITAS